MLWRRTRNNSVRKVSTMLAALMAGTASGIVALATPAYAGNCSVTSDNPHYSSGAGGVISKLRINCTGISNITYTYRLWLCADKPVVDGWIWYCSRSTLKGENKGSFNPANGTTYTRYAPPGGGTGAHGSGYWCANVSFGWSGDDGWNGAGFQERSPSAPFISA
jgi:hypothetical protein